ncbi:FkbM family methyltransferase [Jannaschia sp. W003]|uniref:FkbM family methyltransferase n=1 Tax=Jannaschia sp. W003 TaxID=2867012 RepID=UPI0021A54B11|nr:FkbM family methyltransferase [Jannaschia sp. W003]UWQ21096.1 FkbM family methyltransferase [Jannaschia sp. W003]
MPSPTAAAPAAIDPAAEIAGRVQRTKRRVARQRKLARAEGMMQGLLRLLGPGDVAVDCGANVGAVSERFAATGAAVLALEPDPVAFRALRARIGDAPGVHLVNAAAGTAAGRAVLHRSARFDDDPLAGTVGSTLVEGVRAAEVGTGVGVEVEVVDLPATLGALLDGRAPDVAPGLAPGRLALLKMDVEGAEIALLRALHARGLLARIPATVVETHERKFPALRGDFAALRREMAEAFPDGRVFLDWV